MDESILVTVLLVLIMAAAIGMGYYLGERRTSFTILWIVTVIDGFGDVYQQEVFRSKQQAWAWLEKAVRKEVADTWGIEKLLGCEDVVGLHESLLREQQEVGGYSVRPVIVQE